MALTHSGTEFTTSYDDSKLSIAFDKIYSGKSGSVGLFDYEKTFAGNAFRYYGNVAGNVKVLSVTDSSFKISITPLPSAKVPTPKAVYFTYAGPEGKMLALKSDSIIMEENYDNNLKKFRINIKAKGGILYQQSADKIIYCKDCTFEYDEYFRLFHISGNAVAMSLSDYKKLERQLASSSNPVSVASTKLKEWDYIELTDLKWANFIKGTEITFPYREFDEKSNAVKDKPIKYMPTSRIKASMPTKTSAIGKVKMKSYGYAAVEVARQLFYDENNPDNKEYAFYALKGSGVLYDFPHNMFFRHTGKKSMSTGLPTVLHNGGNYMYLYSGDIIGFMKKKNEFGEKNLFYGMHHFIYGENGASFHATIADTPNEEISERFHGTELSWSMPVQKSYPPSISIYPSANSNYRLTVSNKFKRVVGSDIVRSIIYEDDCKMRLPPDVQWYDFGIDLFVSCQDKPGFSRDLICEVRSKECRMDDIVVSSQPGTKISYHE